LENQTLQIRISELEKGSKSNGIVSIVNANGSGDGIFKMILVNPSRAHKNNPSRNPRRVERLFSPRLT